MDFGDVFLFVECLKQETCTKDVWATFSRLGISRPRGDHGSLIGVAHFSRGNGLLARIGSDDGEHLILGDQFQRGRGGRLGFGFIVLVDEVKLISLVSYFKAAGNILAPKGR